MSKKQAPKNDPSANNTGAEGGTAEQSETAQQTEVNKSKITPLTKITVKGVVGKIKVAEIPAEGEEKKLCRMTGIADGTDTGESNFGIWRCLKGSFAATNFATGEMFVCRAKRRRRRFAEIRGGHFHQAVA
jgi:hypothetical protein